MAPVCYGVVGPPQEVADNRATVTAFTENGAYAGCGACRYPDAGFALPLPAGRYRLDFEVTQADGALKRESRMVEVKTGRWVEIYALGAKPGPVPFTPCPRLP